MTNTIYVSGLFIKAQRVGGAEQMFYNLIECLVGANYKVVIFIESVSDIDPCKLSEYTQCLAIDLHEYSGGIPRIIKEYMLPTKIPKNARVIYPNYICSPLCIFKKQKAFVFIHDLQYLHYPKNFKLHKRAFQYVSHQLAILFAKRVVAISSFVRDDLMEQYVLYRLMRRKLHVVWNCISEKRAAHTELNSVDDTPSSPYLLMISSHYPHKNIPLLVESYIKSSLPQSNIKLILVGQLAENITGSVKTNNLGNLQDNEMIEVTGFVSEARLESLLKGSLGLLQPSKFEGFGMPVVEAICKSRLVVASDIPPFRELVGDLPIYVQDYLCANAWVKTLNKLADPNYRREREALIVSEREAVQRRFSVSAISKKLGDLLG